MFDRLANLLFVPLDQSLGPAQVLRAWAIVSRELDPRVNPVLSLAI